MPEGTGNNKDKLIPNLVDFPTHEQSNIDNFVHISRTAYNYKPAQLFMIGIAWVLPSERSFVKMFPEGIVVNATNNTNDEERPLLTIRGKDSNGKMFTALRVFLPNE